ncbi:MAG: SgcJ/EcaC family oxidoreductase [Gemmataceae bacterium]|nr:SgcJ/EcaC family oxidoreductase [Gemmataceae bacterium]
MSTRSVWALAVAGAAVGSAALWVHLGRPAAAQPPKDAPSAPRHGGDPADAAAIEKNAAAFVAAFEKGDPDALAAFWAPDGELTDVYGRRLTGRGEIGKAFGELFDRNKGLKARVEGESLRFLTPEVAVEEGVTFVLRPDGSPPTRTRYSNLHVKKGGRWHLASVREAPYLPPSNYPHLRGLEWAVGEWAAAGDGGETEHLSVAWAEGQNFLVATFAAAVNGLSVGRSTHWVGWDPRDKRVRSWLFDAAGGFGDGAWARDGDDWVVKTASVLPDGKPATATFVLGPGPDGTLRLRAKDRTVDGKPLPDRKEIRLKRVR